MLAQVLIILPLAAVAVLGPSLSAPAAQPGTGSGSLQEAVRQAGEHGPGWLSYTVDADTRGQFVCCISLHGDRRRCRPESRDDGWSMSSSASQPGARTDRLRVLLAVDGGQVRQIHAYSVGCEIELARPLIELAEVDPDDSVSLLQSLARHAAGAARSGEAGLADQALSTLALHAVPTAERALVELAASAQPIELRRPAIFWLGQKGSEGAVRELSAMLDGEPVADLREHLVFSLSQTDQPTATRRIRRAAEHDTVPEVRGQAWFWLAQSGAPEAAEWIRRAIATDPDAEVRQQAVFALSQLPDAQATDELLRVLRETKDGDLQRQALFWLAESGDPRAIEHLSAILER